MYVHAEMESRSKGTLSFLQSHTRFSWWIVSYKGNNHHLWFTGDMRPCIYLHWPCPLFGFSLFSLHFPVSDVSLDSQGCSSQPTTARGWGRDLIKREWPGPRLSATCIHKESKKMTETTVLRARCMQSLFLLQTHMWRTDIVSKAATNSHFKNKFTGWFFFGIIVSSDKTFSFFCFFRNRTVCKLIDCKQKVVYIA